ncbi:DUF6954 family protein [Pseudalkalibacillus sp. SCS-8]|uniref:DUF6954 family protein n=1 Tax=Pseudalkalibacillus nanhaiensis TaxID=3115291 RepID=UPI0039C93752
MKWLFYLLFLILYFFITFFGYGPILFGDSNKQELISGLVIVTLLEVVLSFFFIRWMLKNKMNKLLIAPPFLFILAVIIFFSGIWR